MLAIRLSEDIEKRLTALAKETSRTKTFFAYIFHTQLNDFQERFNTRSHRVE